MRVTKFLVIATLAGVLAGCASSAVVVGKVRPAITPAQVKLYVNPPKQYEEIALLETNSQGTFSFTEQAKMDAVIAGMKEQAAKVGANGILLRGTGERQSGSIGTGGFGGNVALGASLGLSHKVGNGVAIYVEVE